MRLPRSLAAAVAVAVTATGLTVGAGSAQAAPDRKPGDRSLARVLAADSGFDRDGRDFDVLEAAVAHVLDERPNSPLAVLADGDTRLTAFLPTDTAFRRLVQDLIGKSPKRERGVAKRVIALTGDAETLESVLLYHVVPGRTLPKKRVVAAAEDRASLATALGESDDAPRIGVRADRDTVRLADADRDDLDPRAIPALLNLNVGNKQVAHGINRVLRPADL